MDEDEARRFKQHVQRMANDYARQVEHAGDFVGPNDMALANKLWSAAVGLKEYARERGPAS